MPAGFTQVVVTGAARHDYVVGYVSRNVCLPDGTCPLVTEGVGWHRGRVELFGQVDAIPFAVNSKGLVVGGGSVWQFSAARR
jgi:hypothetical protein